MDSTSVVPESNESIFGAVLRRQRSRWRWWVALSLVGFTAAVAFARRTGGNFRVMTPAGFRQIKKGMTPSQVGAVLGAGPIAQVRDDGADCLLYGHPTLQQPDFLVYEACYRDGALWRVKEKSYSAQSLDLDAMKRLVPQGP